MDAARGAPVTALARRTLGAGLWLALTAAALAYQTGVLVAAQEARPLVAVAFVALAPGFGWARLLAGADPWTRWALTLGISLALSTLTAFALAVLAAWAPTLGLALLAVVGGLGVLVWLVAARRAAPARGAAPAPLEAPPGSAP